MISYTISCISAFMQQSSPEGNRSRASCVATHLAWGGRWPQYCRPHHINLFGVHFNNIFRHSLRHRLFWWNRKSRAVHIRSLHSINEETQKTMLSYSKISPVKHNFYYKSSSAFIKIGFMFTQMRSLQGTQKEGSTRIERGPCFTELCHSNQAYNNQ